MPLLAYRKSLRIAPPGITHTRAHTHTHTHEHTHTHTHTHTCTETQTHAQTHLHTTDPVSSSYCFPVTVLSLPSLALSILSLPSESWKTIQNYTSAPTHTHIHTHKCAHTHTHKSESLNKQTTRTHTHTGKTEEDMMDTEEENMELGWT